jgi:hypothetical protein
VQNAGSSSRVFSVFVIVKDTRFRASRRLPFAKGSYHVFQPWLGESADTSTNSIPILIPPHLHSLAGQHRRKPRPEHHDPTHQQKPEQKTSRLPFSLNIPLLGVESRPPLAAPYILLALRPQMPVSIEMPDIVIQTCRRPTGPEPASWRGSRAAITI